MKVYIYILIHPLSNNVFYVGCSNCPQKRFYTHWHKKNNKTILHLREIDIKPIMKVIDEVDISKAREVEVKWIEHYQDLGFELENKDVKSRYNKQPKVYSKWTKEEITVDTQALGVKSLKIKNRLYLFM